MTPSKYISIGLTALMLSLGISKSATVSVVNSDGINVFSLVGDSGNTLVESGTITIGTYTSEPVTAADYLTDFTQFGSSISFFGPTAPGYYTGSISEAIGVGSFFEGTTVYVIMESGGEVAVWKATSNPAGNTFTADNPIGGPSDLTVLTTTGTLLIGSIDSYAVPGFGNQDGFTLEAIPEPSTMLLGGLGALLLLRRRRGQD